MKRVSGWIPTFVGMMRAGALVMMLIAGGTPAPLMGAGPGSVQDYAEFGRRGDLINGTFTLNGNADVDTILWTLPDSVTSSTRTTFALPVGTLISSANVLTKEGYPVHLIGGALQSLAMKLASFGAGDSAYVDSVWIHYYDEDGFGPLKAVWGRGCILRSNFDYNDPEYKVRYWDPDSTLNGVTAYGMVFPIDPPMGRCRAYVMVKERPAVADTVSGASRWWGGGR